MKEVRILEIKESVFADNDRQADKLRRELKEQGVFLMNLMSSPGSGKTTTLKGTIERLKDQLRIFLSPGSGIQYTDHRLSPHAGDDHRIHFMSGYIPQSIAQN